MKTRVVTDVSSLPRYGFGPSASTWWGTLGFCAIEGTGFAPPVHWPGTILTILLLASLVPNVMVDRAAHAHDLPKVRWLLVLLTAIGLIAIAIRFVEFYMLIPRWDSNAYGSIIWFLLGLHATHIITDVGDTIVLTALMFTKHGRAKRFADVSDNAFYWYFVVGAWLPIYYLVYWFPIL